MESVERQSGIRDPKLDIPELPEECRPWFIRFFEIKKTETITFSELYAYQQLYGIQLSPVEISAIMAMDRGASDGIAEVMKEEASKQG